MPRKKSQIPVLRLHKPSGRARVYIDGDYVYLGPWGSEEANREYRRVIAERITFLESGADNLSSEMTVNELVAAFLVHAKSYYVGPDGEQTSSFGLYVLASRRVLDLYGEMLVVKFGPRTLEIVQKQMVADGFLRDTVNKYIVYIRSIFRWGVAREFVPETIYRALCCLPSLQEGRTKARESKPVPQADISLVLKTIEYCHKTIADMVRVQLLSGMRPQEVRLMRSCDIDRSDDIWVYMPHKHKTRHKGKYRPIPIMPQSQAILMPYLIDKQDEPESYLFSPGDAMKMLGFEKRAKRKTKVQPSQMNRSKGRKYKPCYSTDAYRAAIQRSANAAGIPCWSPNQLRHTKATEVEKLLGIEAAQMLLGHASAETTKIYLDPDVKLKEQIEAVNDLRLLKLTSQKTIPVTIKAKLFWKKNKISVRLKREGKSMSSNSQWQPGTQRSGVTGVDGYKVEHA